MAKGIANLDCRQLLQSATKWSKMGPSNLKKKKKKKELLLESLSVPCQSLLPSLSSPVSPQLPHRLKIPAQHLESDIFLRIVEQNERSGFQNLRAYQHCGRLVKGTLEGLPSIAMNPSVCQLAQLFPAAWANILGVIHPHGLKVSARHLKRPVMIPYLGEPP